MKGKKIISAVTAAVMLASTAAFAAEITTKYPFGTLTRRMEELDRGLVAMKTDGGIYLSWRLMSGEDTRFGSGEENVTFDIYRDGEMIGTEESTTNYLDESGTENSKYYVVSSNDDTSKTVSAFKSGKNYFDIPLNKPANSPYGAYTINDCSTGDLDGDGEYEIIVKWDANGKDNSQSGTTGDVLLDAYNLDGTRVWEEPINLGKNIRAGAHYTQFLVYDFDLDGKAEITCKTAPGSKDAKGAYVSEASSINEIKNTDNKADYRNKDGYILTGDEYFTIFDGETGAALDTIYYPVQRINASVWGDTYGNRVDRYIATVSWLDGEKPYAVYWRGYYYGNPGQRTGICAMSFNGERLSTDYCFDTYDTSKTEDYKGVNGYTEGNEIYVGEGNHNMTTADVDGDGKDEFISGSLCMEVNDENKLMPKWCSFRQHGDALHIGAYDPTREGYVYFSVHEDGGMSGNGNVPLDYGMTLYDAATGEELLHRGNNDDTGRGMMANVGAGGYFQFWGAGTYIAKGNNEYEATTINGSSSNFRIFWDGDLFDELMEGQDGKPLTVSSWNGSAMSGIFTTDGCRSVNGTKANPSLQADILGDWREEIVMARDDNNALRVFVSDIPTDYKIMTLMHDSVYRSGVAAEQTAYNQPPHVGFYMDETDFSGPVTALKITKQPTRTEYFVGDTLDTSGMEVSVVYENGKEMPVKGYTVDGYDPYAGGEQTLSVTYGGVSADLTVTVKTSFQINEDGIITGTVSTGENTAILPDSINGIAVKGFADGSMKESELNNLYIYNNDLTFEGSVFGDGITIHAYEESSAKTYCEENDVKFLVINVNFSYTADENYDEGFESFMNNFIVTQGGAVIDSKSINGITYGNNPRTDSYPDATTGIKIANEGGNTYLVPVAGEFSTRGRNSWLEIDEKTELASVSEYTFKFDILYPTDCGTLTLTMSDGENTVDSVEITAGMETDTWYTYTYRYDEKNNLTRTISKGTNVIEEKDLGPARGKYGISKIDFNRNPNGINPSTLWGGWGNHGMGACALAYMDNIQAFTPELAAARFIVTDKYNCPVEDALVSMDGTLVRTDKNGIAEIKRENGQYSAEISAEGYMSTDVDVTLLEGVQEVPITLKYAEPEITEFSMNRSEITIPVGYCDFAEYTISPLSFDNGITFTSSDPAIASVDEDGVITALAEGETVITASKGDKTTECEVTVINADYDRAPDKIVLTGNDTMIANPFGTGEEMITAEVYDKNNARIYDAPVTFTYDGADSAEVYDYAITVKGGKNDITVTAKCGDVQAEKVIKAADSEYTKYASSDFSGNTRLVQGKEAQSYAIEDSGITLNVGARSNGGDGYSGFVMANGVLTGQAGKYNTSSRNGYITFDEPPRFGGSDEYRFRTKIKFTTDAATVTLKDGNTGITALSPSSGFDKNVEYIYELLYSNGEFTQVVTNTATGEITQTPIYSSAKNLSRIDITSDGTNEAVVFDDMSIMSASRINSRATICVYDENGDSVEGAKVASDSDSAETMANGRATVRCYAGANTFKIEKNDQIINVIENITSDKQLVNVMIREPRLRLIDAAEPFWYLQSMNGFDYASAEYDGAALKSVVINSHAAPYGKGLFSAAAGDSSKIFIWDDMKPLTQAFDNTK